MSALRRIKLGDLDIATRDVFDHDPQYVYDEIFVGAAYDHPKIRLPEHAVIMDVGANVGFYSIWAAQKYQPRAIFAYEASPSTYDCLADNASRLIKPEMTRASCFNLAVSREAGRELVLNQPPWNSGLSTLVDGSKLPWVGELRDKGELITHIVRTTTVSHEMAAHGLDHIDLLKIDVEGHFIEVLDGIAAADFARIRHIVLEAEYADELGHSRESLAAILRSKGYSVDAKDAAQIMIYAWRG